MRHKKEANIEIGKRIHDLRVKNSLTQEALSERLEITVNHLSAIERGASGPSLETVWKMMKVFGATSDFILFGETPIDSNDRIDSQQERIDTMVRRLRRLSSVQREKIEKAPIFLIENFIE